MSELVDMFGVVVYVDDVVQVISVHDDTLERGDTISLPETSTDDEDYSGMSDLTDDADSDISETDAHEVDDLLVGFAVDNGDMPTDLLSYYNALYASGYEAHIETRHDTAAVLIKSVYVRSTEAGLRDTAFAFARDPITNDPTIDAGEFDISEATVYAVRASNDASRVVATRTATEDTLVAVNAPARREPPPGEGVIRLVIDSGAAATKQKSDAVFVTNMRSEPGGSWGQPRRLAGAGGTTHEAGFCGPVAFRTVATSQCPVFKDAVFMPSPGGDMVSVGLLNKYGIDMIFGNQPRLHKDGIEIPFETHDGHFYLDVYPEPRLLDLTQGVRFDKGPAEDGALNLVAVALLAPAPPRLASGGGKNTHVRLAVCMSRDSDMLPGLFGIASIESLKATMRACRLPQLTKADRCKVC